MIQSRGGQTGGVTVVEERRFPSREPPTTIIDSQEFDLYLRTGSMFKRERSAPNFRVVSGFSQEIQRSEQLVSYTSVHLPLQPQTIVIGQQSQQHSHRNLLLPPSSHQHKLPTSVERLSFGASHQQQVLIHSSLNTSQRESSSPEPFLRNCVTVPGPLTERSSVDNPFLRGNELERSTGFGHVHVITPRTPTLSTVHAHGEVSNQPRISNTQQTQPGRTFRAPYTMQPPASTRVVTNNQQRIVHTGMATQNQPPIVIRQQSPPQIVTQKPLNLPAPQIGQQVHTVVSGPQAQRPWAPAPVMQIRYEEPGRKMSSPAVVHIESSPRQNQPNTSNQGAQPQGLPRAAPSLANVVPATKGLAQVLAKLAPETSKNIPSAALQKIIIENKPTPPVKKPNDQQDRQKESVAFKSMFLSDPVQVQHAEPIPVPAKLLEIPKDKDKIAVVVQDMRPNLPETRVTGIPERSPVPQLKDSSLMEGESEKTDQYIVVETQGNLDIPKPAPLSLEQTNLMVWSGSLLSIKPKSGLGDRYTAGVVTAQPGFQVPPSPAPATRVLVEKLPPLQIAPSPSQRNTAPHVTPIHGDPFARTQIQAVAYPISPPPVPREGSFPYSPHRGSQTTGALADESQLAKVLDQLYSGQGAILQQLGNLAVGNPWVILKELEARTEREQKKLEQILLEKERMEGLIEGLREQLREERSKFQMKKASQVRELRHEPNSLEELKPHNERAHLRPSYSKSQVVEANVVPDGQPNSEGYAAVDPLHGFASMMHSQILGHDDNQTQFMGSNKGEKLSVRSKGLSASKVTYNPPSVTAVQRQIPREIIESQAVNSGVNFVPYYWQGTTQNENVPVLFDIKPESSIHKSNATGEADNSYMGKKIVSRFATIVPGQGAGNTSNDELARMKEMYDRLAEENRQLVQMLKGKNSEAEPSHMTPKETDRTFSEDIQVAQPNYRKLDYFGARPSIQTKIGGGFMNINLAIPELRSTQYSGKMGQGELSPVIETDMDGVRVSGPPEADHVKETHLQQLQNYLSPETQYPQPPPTQQPTGEMAPTRGYNSVFSFQPSMEMISALTQYVNNPNMTAEQSGIKGLPLLQSKTFGMESTMPAEGGRISVATGHFGFPGMAVSTHIPTPTNNLMNSQIADTTSGLKGSNTELGASASNAEGNLDHSSAQTNEKTITVSHHGQILRKSQHQKKRNLSDVGRMREDTTNRITEVAENEEGQPNTDRELEEELKKKDQEIFMLRTIIGNLAPEGSDPQEKARLSIQSAQNHPERTSNLLTILNDAMEQHFGRSSNLSNQKFSNNPVQRNSASSTSMRSNQLVPSLNLGQVLMKNANIIPAVRTQTIHEDPQDSQLSLNETQKLHGHQNNLRVPQMEDSEEFREHEDSFGQQESPVRDFSGFIPSKAEKNVPAHAWSRDAQKQEEMNDPKEADQFIHNFEVPKSRNFQYYGGDQEEENI